MTGIGAWPYCATWVCMWGTSSTTGTWPSFSMRGGLSPCDPGFAASLIFRKTKPRDIDNETQCNSNSLTLALVGLWRRHFLFPDSLLAGWNSTILLQRTTYWHRLQHLATIWRVVHMISYTVRMNGARTVAHQHTHTQPLRVWEALCQTRVPIQHHADGLGLKLWLCHWLLLTGFYSSWGHLNWPRPSFA